VGVGSTEARTGPQRAMITKAVQLTAVVGDGGGLLVVDFLLFSVVLQIHEMWILPSAFGCGGIRLWF
jgi:hypothetical protein